ncbi:HAD domain-containing protein [Rhodoferax sp. TS-BS-61-7]|uniref:HAD domain-containing protein n=1 Tax=Rhodoferax sp. TS-BS-61-7 TaxID=2094194 RepID=UPI000CF66B07|nr:HAD domain-containing protein [Rhodoferax sp. TS-BS-61-7]PQA78071.1 hypothetical protein C5F53_06975 [Rhodoferax sp. TS-BS-61-7]
MRPLSGNGLLLLYLDFDGVLHHENVLWHPRIGAYLSAPEQYKIFQHIGLLETLLAPYPQVRIVLSTSWVRRYGCAKSAKQLGPRLRQRVLGATFHSRMDEDLFMELPRGQQVWEDVLRRKPRGWIALDDDGEGWPPESAGKFIQTHDKDGISHPEVLERLKAALEQLCSK